MDLFVGVKSSYIAQGLSDEQVQAVVGICELIRRTDLQEIVAESDQAKDIYIILSGQVRVTTVHGDPIARLGAGAIVGEIALFEDAERSATVVSDGDSSLVRIPATKFNQLMDQRPDIGLNVLRNVGRTLCHRLRSSNVQLEAVLSVL